MSDKPLVDITISVQIATNDPPSLDRLRAAIIWVLARHDMARGASLSVVIMDDEGVRRLNREYRGIDRPTDVLSFAAEPLPYLDEERNLGDLILSLPTVRRQAETEGHNWRDEMVLAVIHGTLHLLGYDHDTPESQTMMWQVQAEALAAMNVSIQVPLFTFDDDGEG